MVVCLIVSGCYMFEFLTDRIDRKTTGKKIILEPTYTYILIYKQGIQLQYERYT